MKKIMLVPCFTILIFAFLFSGCDSEKLYTCNNRSSHSVTITDSNGSGIVIPAGGSKSIYLVNNVTLNDIYYSPSNLVSVFISGQTITFRDK